MKREWKYYEPGASELEIRLTRVLPAPRELVFKAFTDPELIPRWWGPRSLRTVVDRMEVKTGGSWRYLQYDAEGNEYAFNGVYREVIPPERLVYTFEFEGAPGQLLITTVTLEDLGDKTRYIEVTLFPNVETLEEMSRHDMEEGAIESIVRFEELLQELQA